MPRLRGRRNDRKAPIHASGLEDKVIQDLEERGIDYEYEPETIEYVRVVRGATCAVCNGNKTYVRRRYTPDLKIGAFYVEIKGKLDSETRSRMEAFRKGHPEIDLRFLFGKDNWITRKHKTKYSEWAEKNGFKWAIGTRIPDHWIQPTSPAMTTATPTG